MMKKNKAGQNYRRESCVCMCVLDTVLDAVVRDSLSNNISFKP
jgi:hypothetical protein